MSEELKRCPCCNGVARFKQSRVTAIVECTECGLMIFDYRDGVKRDAIKLWNRRAETGRGM